MDSFILGVILEQYTASSEHVVIPNTVTMIGNNAFERCLLKA